MKKIVSIVLLFTIVLSFAFSNISYANTETLVKVENIIAGQQDKLVFGTIVSVSSQVCSVEVMEEVGENKTGSESEGSNSEPEEQTSFVGQKIDVVGLDLYMYYEGLDHRPKKGDNVLLSLTFNGNNGNSYKIKNGAFIVSAASHDTFNFIVPDYVDGTQSAMELTALYKFVSSNGRNADYTIRDSVVYTHDIANGEEIRISDQAGIKFINEKGETTKEAENSNVISRDNTPGHSSSAWVQSLVIIGVGALVGMLIVKLAINFEKRAENK